MQNLSLRNDFLYVGLIYTFYQTQKTLKLQIKNDDQIPICLHKGLIIRDTEQR